MQGTHQRARYRGARVGGGIPKTILPLEHPPAQLGWDGGDTQWWRVALTGLMQSTEEAQDMAGSNTQAGFRRTPQRWLFKVTQEGKMERWAEVGKHSFGQRNDKYKNPEASPQMTTGFSLPRRTVNLRMLCPCGPILCQKPHLPHTDY